MFFRNLSLFRFSAATATDLSRLEDALEQNRLRPCGPMEMTTRGAVAPVGDGDDAPLLMHSEDCVLLCIGGEDKLLPAAVINQELARRIQAITAEEGRPVTGRERKQLKAAVLDELMPRALAKPSRLLAYADLARGWLVFDSSSRKASEGALSRLRDALGSFPAVPLAAEKSPRQLLTQWLHTGDLPAGLSLGDECELREPDGKGGAVIRCRNLDLEEPEVKEHLKNGKEVFQLGVEYNDRFGCVIGEDLTIRKLRFFDDVLDAVDEVEAESAWLEAQTRFTLMVLELRQFFDEMEKWFQLPRPEDA